MDDQLVESLLKRAEEYEGYDDIRDQLIGEACAAGCLDDEAVEVADEVLKRLEGTHTNKTNGKLGKTSNYGDMAVRISEMRY